jgi:pyrimidine-nucleoside phosphorylase
VMRLDARSVGEAAVVLGAGRRTKGDAIEPGTGIEVFPSIGSRLEPGQPAFRVHARSQDEAEAVRPCLEDAITVSAIQVPKSPLILGEM